MSFQPDKSQLESSFAVLKQQASSTFENWDDPIQRRFYEQFINSLPQEVLAYINELNKLDKSFETAEQHINDLHE
ncbi:MAG: hypothetical protein EXR16_04920 [Bacteroidetes bacterium]|nr:hypothetical protein [Bacteroidota bacterium]